MKETCDGVVTGHTDSALGLGSSEVDLRLIVDWIFISLLQFVPTLIKFDLLMLLDIFCFVLYMILF